MKIVLSGTDSLGFLFAQNKELYDRAVTIHTTFVPFSEYSRLLRIDEYIRYGGTLNSIRHANAFDDGSKIICDPLYASFRTEAQGGKVGRKCVL